MCVCVRACVHVCVRACMHACVHECMHVCVCMHMCWGEEPKNLCADCAILSHVAVFFTRTHTHTQCQADTSAINCHHCEKTKQMKCSYGHAGQSVKLQEPISQTQ